MPAAGPAPTLERGEPMRIPLVLAAAIALSACAGAGSAARAGAPGPEPAPGAVRSPDRVGDGLEPAPLDTNAGAIEGVVAAVDREAGTVSLQAGDTVRTVPLAAEATVLDVGQGLAIHVQTAKHDLLFDAGPAFSADADSGNRIVVRKSLAFPGKSVEKVLGSTVQKTTRVALVPRFEWSWLRDEPLARRRQDRLQVPMSRQ